MEPLRLNDNFVVQLVQEPQETGLSLALFYQTRKDAPLYMFHISPDHMDKIVAYWLHHRNTEGQRTAMRN